MDNFKGQITDQIVQLLSDNNVHVVLIPPNCTDQFQPMDLSVNKPAKEFLRSKFSDWYSEKVRQQIDDVDDIGKVELVPVDLRFWPSGWWRCLITFPTTLSLSLVVLKELELLIH